MKLDAILQKLATGKRKVRMRALVDLAIAGPKARAAVEPVRQILESDADGELRANALYTLNQIGGNDVYEVIFAHKDDPDPLVRCMAASALAGRGEHDLAASILDKLVTSDDPLVRSLAEQCRAQLPAASHGSRQQSSAGSEALNWNEDIEAWTGRVETPAFGTVDILVRPQDRQAEPTARQIEALNSLASVPESLRETIRTDALRYAAEFLEDEDVEDLQSDPNLIDFSQAVIPPLRESASTYVFLHGESDIDIEHGVACLIRDGRTARVCHADHVLATYGWDETTTLDRILEIAS